MKSNKRHGVKLISAITLIQVCEIIFVTVLIRN